MKRAYYYFLFRIYWYYKDKVKENDATALFSVTAVSTTLISINLLFLYGVMDNFNFTPMLTNKYYTVFIMVSIGFVNHYLFVRNKKFLNYGFEKDRKGGIYIVIYIILSFVFSFVEGKYNREKIFEGRADEISNEPQKESLEGKIRKWFD
ncbi:hypothetical protein J2X69_003362 [Algoriphagus sp. 4150]|uniref:hypothetical protein n=1 Tax=Algoriphagus sp. 4150 TaxID=2817756 RepID=UPI0028586662|nr:hypothetical protein [Algoriphagus sp. 4150]MDR7131003.1 hypothetical protein [Algoriphagus sp. 4150]